MTKKNDSSVFVPSHMHIANETGYLHMPEATGTGTTGRGLKRRLGVVASALAAALLAVAPVQAQNLGLSIDQLIERIGNAADAAGQPLEFNKLNCIENDSPVNPGQKILSCTHTMGNGRLLISNSELEGPVIDIATQPWDGGENGPGAMMIAWIAAAINNGESADYVPAANALVGATASEGMGDASIEQVSFFVLDMGSQLAITAQAN